MRESLFIKNHQQKWEEAEDLLKKKGENPEHASRLYQIVANHSSFARTHFYHRKVRVYLNELNQHLFSHIYKNRKQNFGKFVTFWTKDLPLLMYQCRKQLLLSLLIFTVATLIGILSSVKDPNFNRTILGDEYIEKTLENIENGEPMAIYKSRGQFEMFTSITFNNIRVAFLAYVLGILWGLGTVIILLSNGVMLGSFQYFFVERGLFFESALSIWQHGVIEISSVIIAGGAGLVLSKGILFPGTFSRSISLRMSALRSVKIMTSLVPMFIIAGFIEGFFTRQTHLSDGVRVMTIVISLVFVVGYFIVMPLMAHYKYAEEEVDIQEDMHSELEGEENELLTGTRIVAPTLRLIWKNFTQMGWKLILIPLIYAILMTVIKMGEMYNFNDFGVNRFIPNANWATVKAVVLQWMVLMVFMLSSLKVWKLWTKKSLVLASVLAFAMAILQMLLAPLDVIFTFIFYPFLFSILLQRQYNNSAKATMRLIFKNFGFYLGPLALTLLIVYLSSGLMKIFSFYRDFFISWNFVGSGLMDEMDLITFLNNFVWQLKMVLIIYVLNALMFVLHKSLREIDSADNLKQRIAELGTKRRFKFERS